jgi:ribonuclease PH
LALAVAKLREKRAMSAPVLTGMLAAVSVGMVLGRPVLDLDYIEDSAAEVDMNVVRIDDGRFVEVQSTAETEPFRRDRLDTLLDLAGGGIDKLHVAQREALGDALAGTTAAR